MKKILLFNLLGQTTKATTTRLRQEIQTSRRDIHIVQPKIEPKLANVALKRYIFHGINPNDLNAQFEFELQNSQPLLVRPGEILARVRSTTICLSDIHTVCGAR